jgi:hypothetical protein
VIFFMRGSSCECHQDKIRANNPFQVPRRQDRG